MSALAQETGEGGRPLMVDAGAASRTAPVWTRRIVGAAGDIEFSSGANRFCRIHLISEVAARVRIELSGSSSQSSEEQIPGDTEIRVSFRPSEAEVSRISVRAAATLPGMAEFRFMVEECRTSGASDDRLIQADRAFAHAASAGTRTSTEQEKAVTALEAAIDFWREQGNPQEVSAALILAGEIEQRIGRPNTRERMEDAVKVATSSNNRRTLARAQRAMGNLLLQKQDAAAAIRLFDAAAESARQAGDRAEEARVVTSLGYATEMRGAIGDAPPIYDRAIALWREEAWRPGLAWALLERSHNAIDRGDEHAAIPTLEECSKLLEALGDRTKLATALRAFGGLYSKLDDKQRALTEFEKAKRLLPAEGEEKQRATLQNSMGQIYYDLGQYPVAIDYYRDALRLLEKLDDLAAVARTTQQLGRCAFGMGDAAIAMQRYEAALGIYRRLNDRRWQSRVLQDIALLMMQDGNPERAVISAREALSLIEREDDNYTRADALRTMALALHAGGQLDEALPRYTEALKLSRERGYRNGEAWTCYHMARLERDRGNLGASRSILVNASVVVESVRSSIAGNELRATYFASMQEYFGLFVDVLMQLEAKNPGGVYAQEAFAVHERGKARMLLDTLREARVEFREGVSEELLAREASIRNRLDRLAEREALASGGGAVQKQRIAEELREAGGEYEQIQALIRIESPRYAAVHLPQPVSLREVQEKLLDAGTVLLEYALGEASSYLWVVTKSETETHILPGRKDLNERVSAFHETITAREPRTGESARDRRLRIRAAEERYGKHASELSAILLAPAADLIRGKRLAVAADGVLNYLPFAALASPATTPGETMRPLIIDHELVVLPSVSALAELRNETAGRKAAARLLAIMADPVMEPDDPRMPARGNPVRGRSGEPSNGGVGTRLGAHARFARLPSSNVEALAIAALLPEGEVQLWSGYDANRESVMSGGLGSYRFIHFATHSVLYEEHPELSGIVLSGFDASGREIASSGFLRLHDLYNLRLTAEMVVLSSCESQLGADIRGEGLVGIVRGFFYAGSKRVVSSLWKVDDLGTKELMLRLYRNMIIMGESPASALRHAQAEMWREGEWRSPYYWAAFVLQGEWQ